MGVLVELAKCSNLKTLLVLFEYPLIQSNRDMDPPFVFSPFYVDGNGDLKSVEEIQSHRGV